VITNEVRRLLADRTAVASPPSDPELAAVEVAILLEDAFDVVLGDDDIDPAVLCDPDAAAALVARLRGI
jgi:hypothetical protein